MGALPWPESFSLLKNRKLYCPSGVESRSIRYRSKDKERLPAKHLALLNPTTVEGHLYAQITSAVSITSRIIEDSGRLGVEGVEAVIPSPMKHYTRLSQMPCFIVTIALRTTSISASSTIRVEVQSPGRLPAHITPDNILDERFARNGTIVRLVNKFPNPPNKDVGEGLNTAFAAMHKMGLKEPTVQNLESAVLVLIKHEALASPEVIILEHLETHETIRNKEAREICHIQADYIVKELFKRLSDRQLIERVPGTRTGGTTYQKGPRFAEWRGQPDVIQR